MTGPMIMPMRRAHTFDHIRASTRGSRTVLRLRTPEHLPLDHSAAQSRQRAAEQRQQRNTMSKNVRKAYVDSGNLRQYSRKRFEFVIKSHGGEELSFQTLDIRLQSPRQRTWGYRMDTSFPKTPTKQDHAATGPTKIGSVLYNKTPLLLNSIRVRPQSECQKYSHKDRKYPEIDKTLRKVNSEYVVRSLPGSRGCPMTPSSRASSRPVSEFRLIPRANTDSFCDDFLSCDGAKTAWPETSKQRQRHDSDSESSGDASSRHPQTRRVENIFSINPAYRAPGCQTRLCDGPGVERRLSDGSLPESEASVTSSASDRPLCWVDEVTVSSELSVQEEEQTTNESPDKGGVQKGQQKPTLNEKAAKQKNTAEVVNDPKTADAVEQPTVEPVGGGNCENENRSEAESSLSESESDDILPPFICPSSERKSREAAIKLWLARTNFLCADRNIPLL